MNKDEKSKMLTHAPEFHDCRQKETWTDAELELAFLACVQLNDELEYAKSSLSALQTCVRMMERNEGADEAPQKRLAPISENAKEANQRIAFIYNSLHRFPFTIRVDFPNAPSLYLLLDSENTKIGVIYACVAKKLGVDEGSFSLVRFHASLEKHKTLLGYGITPGTTIAFAQH